MCCVCFCRLREKRVGSWLLFVCVCLVESVTCYVCLSVCLAVGRVCGVSVCRGCVLFSTESVKRYFVLCQLSQWDFSNSAGRFPQEKPAATESRYPTLSNFNVHAGSFRVSIIHRTLRTTGSLTCVRDHFHACVYTRGLGTPPTTQLFCLLCS